MHFIWFNHANIGARFRSYMVHKLPNLVSQNICPQNPAWGMHPLCTLSQTPILLPLNVHKILSFELCWLGLLINSGDLQFTSTKSNNSYLHRYLTMSAAPYLSCVLSFVHDFLPCELCLHLAAVATGVAGFFLWGQAPRGPKAPSSKIVC